MALDFPESRQEVYNRMLADVQSQLPTSNPYFIVSYLNALIAAMAGRIFEVDTQIELDLKQSFPDTATGEFLERWGSYRSVNLNSATASIGDITITGVNGATIPAFSLLTDESNIQYETQAEETISTQSLNVASLVRSGDTAILTTTSNHNLATNVVVTIQGADQVEYNVTTSIIVTSLNEFTYQLAGTPVTPATGSITVNLSYTSAAIKSTTTGSDTNATGGQKLSFVTQINDVDQATYVQFDGLTGGEDIETTASYRKRVLFSWQNPNTPFNAPNIIIQAENVSGVTRVWVFGNVGQPYNQNQVGQATVFFVRDNDSNIIPSSEDVQNVRDEILKILAVPTSPDYLFVLAPTPVVVDFVFSSLDPDTSTMQQAIIDNLEAAFKESTDVGQNVPQNVYECAIFNTVDPNTGDTVKSFYLLNPFGDITVNFGELAVLGNVTFQ